MAESTSDQAEDGNFDRPLEDLPSLGMVNMLHFIL